MSTLQSFPDFARRGYAGNEIVYAAIELLATSAAEPHIIGRRLRRSSPQIRAEAAMLVNRGLSPRLVNAALVRNGFVEQLDNHPLIRKLNAPNPFMSRGQMWSSVTRDVHLAGNAYLLKARYTDGLLKGALAELWRLRPDRVRVIPDRETFCKYEYTIGRDTTTFEHADVIQFKTGNPLDDYYGMPPMMAISGRIDIDSYLRTFVKSFFEQGGVGPEAILALKSKVNDTTREEIKDRHRRQFGGPGRMHELMVIDQNEATYTKEGLDRGLRDLLPLDLDAIQEARIAMVFGIPGSILGLRTGMESSSYANKRQDWQVLWDVKITPMLSDFDDTLNLTVVPEFGGIDEVLFDLSDIRALQEDVDKLRDRGRKDVQTGLMSFEEYREGAGLDPYPTSGTFLVPSNMTVISIGKSPQLVPPTPPAPVPQLSPGQPAEPAAVVSEVRHDCGRLVARDVEGNPELFCGKCNVKFRPVGT
jgi:HK97 family phage portal protein